MKPLQIFIVAGEASGDILGAGLIKALKQHYGDGIEFRGIAGEKMQAAGCQSVYPMERLSVMGIIAVLKRYRELSGKRQQLVDELKHNPPDAFIGIDAPEFNLDFELALKDAGIKTVHYVSPSVWAWRPKRIFKIKKAVDLMLCLFTFEESYYKEHNIKVACVGHPLADQIPLEVDKIKHKTDLGIAADKTVLAVLPGSRSSEIKYIAEPFLKAAELCKQQLPDLEVVVPLINEQRKQQFLEQLEQIKLPFKVHLTVGNSREVMSAADAVLIASGTATLEATLLKKPMVVGYKMSGFSYAIFSRMLKIKNVSLPNLLAGRPIVKELIQKDCQPAKLAEHLLPLLQGTPECQDMIQTFQTIHHELRKDADKIASDAVINLLEHD